MQDLFLDATNLIPSGNTVSSFYVVFDPNPTRQMIATVTFPDTIIGVIATKDELLDSDFLGNASASYLNPSLRGLEGSQDSFTISGSDLMIDFTASTPGDSVRVILGSASPSLSYNPCSIQETTLTGSVTGGSAASAGGMFVQLCEPIGPVGNDNFQSNDLFVFEEQRNVTLAQGLTVDEPAPAVIPAGTRISTYYVSFDPGSSKQLIGTADFPGTILGVMTDEPSLTASDFLGNPTASYLNPSLRGLEGGIDWASVSGSTLTVDLSAASPGDYVRVVVAAPESLPSMGALALVSLTAALSLTGGAVVRRR